VVFEGRPGKRVPLAISVGAAVFPHDGETYETLLAQADGRMYKDKGRRKRHSAPRSRSIAHGTSSPAVEVTDEEIRRAAAGIL
jgi:predicted signal transduction protein with EAL and GGDEF domain